MIVFCFFGFRLWCLTVQSCCKLLMLLYEKNNLVEILTKTQIIELGVLKHVAQVKTFQE